MGNLPQIIGSALPASLGARGIPNQAVAANAPAFLASGFWLLHLIIRTPKMASEVFASHEKGLAFWSAGGAGVLAGLGRW